jgi:uroporphyrinogen-III synthase
MRLSKPASRLHASDAVSGKLQGLTILVPESRELDLFAGMLEAQGARPLRCPLVTILDVEDSAPAEAWLERLLGGGFDDLVLMTGEGLRRLLALAERLGIKAQVVAAIARVRTVVRGPKPTRALRDIGLSPSLTAAAPTSAGLVETLSTLELRGRRVGLQLYPGSVDPAVMTYLSGSGATVFPVTPYRYASDSETDAVAGAIRQMADGAIDVIAFTSKAQVSRLVDVAKEKSLEAALTQGLKRTQIASVGPVVTEALNAIGVDVDAQPDTGFHLKPLIAAIAKLRTETGTH